MIRIEFAGRSYVFPRDAFVDPDEAIRRAKSDIYLVSHLADIMARNVVTMITPKFLESAESYYAKYAGVFCEWRPIEFAGHANFYGVLDCLYGEAHRDLRLFDNDLIATMDEHDLMDVVGWSAVFGFKHLGALADTALEVLRHGGIFTKALADAVAQRTMNQRVDEFRERTARLGMHDDDIYS